MKKLLPLGSVVLLKNAKKRVMICGRVQREVETEKYYDYSGCPYPEGVIDSRHMVLFSNEDIDKVFFIGFQDGEELAIRKFFNEMDEKGAFQDKELKQNEDQN